jgi:hypothetical protein
MRHLFQALKLLNFLLDMVVVLQDAVFDVCYVLLRVLDEGIGFFSVLGVEVVQLEEAVEVALVVDKKVTFGN